MECNEFLLAVITLFVLLIIDIIKVSIRLFCVRDAKHTVDIYCQHNVAITSLSPVSNRITNLS